MSNAIDRARTHIAELREELAAATAAGLIEHPGSQADIRAELEGAHAAYVTAAVTEIASLRAQLSGPQVG